MAEQVVVNATDTMARRLRTGQISSSISKEDFRKSFCNEVSVIITCSADEIKRTEALHRPSLLHRLQRYSNYDTFES